MWHADWGFGGMHFFWGLFRVVAIGVIVAARSTLWIFSARPPAGRYRTPSFSSASNRSR